MKGNYNKGIEYINKFPKIKKWINECCICHVVGYDPDMPQHIGGEYSMSSDFIKKYFKPLKLNNGVCSDCEKVVKKLNK